MSTPLSQLDAVFLRHLDAKSFRRLEDAPDGADADGVMLTCPGPSCDHSLIVWFANPIGGGPTAPASAPGPAGRWQRSGETLATLSLTPSLLLPCWHGFITDGQATTV